MELPQDLKNYEARRFYLFSPDEAGYILIAVLAVGLVFERIGVL